MAFSLRQLSAANGTQGNVNWTDTLEELDTFIHGSLAVGIAFLCTLVASFISVFTIYKHLSTYTHPTLQKNIIRVLFIVPFYASLSWFSLVFPTASVYLESIRDVWEAIVVYCFLNLMLEYCGGENSCVSVIMNHPGAISHMWPLRYCLKEVPLDARFMRLCKRWTIQFVVTKPIMAAINLIVLASGRYDDHAYEVVQLLVYNISYTAALYSLLLFFFATNQHPGVKSRNPLLKFLSVKMIVFATYYQSLLVELIPGVGVDSLALWNNFILCCEMVVFAILHFFAFGWKEFLPGVGNSGKGMEGKTEKKQVKKRDHAFTNARDVLSMKDVATDAYYNFNGKYGSHVLLETDTEYVLGDDTEIINDIPLGSDDLDCANDLTSGIQLTPASQGSDSRRSSGSSGKHRTFKTKSFLFGNVRDFGSSFVPKTEVFGDAPVSDDRIQGFGDTSALSNKAEPPVPGRETTGIGSAASGRRLEPPPRPDRTVNPFESLQSASPPPSSSGSPINTGEDWADFSSIDNTVSSGIGDGTAEVNDNTNSAGIAKDHAVTDISLV